MISASSARLPLPPKIENILRDRMIKQLLNSVTAKYRDLSMSRRSRYFAEKLDLFIQIRLGESRFLAPYLALEYQPDRAGHLIDNR